MNFLKVNRRNRRLPYQGYYLFHEIQYLNQNYLIHFERSIWPKHQHFESIWPTLCHIHTDIICQYCFLRYTDS